MFGLIGNSLFFVGSVGFIYVGLRARHQTAFSASRLRVLAFANALLGLSRAADALYAISVAGSSQWRGLELLTGIQFLIATGFFFDAARRKIMRDASSPDARPPELPRRQTA